MTLKEPETGVLSAQSHRSILHAWLEDISLEMTPRQIMSVGLEATRLRERTPVYIPLLPHTRLADSVPPCGLLNRLGLRPVPHIAARAIADRHELGDLLGNLAEVGVDSILLIAGDLNRPAGAFSDTIDILDTGLLKQFGIGRIGVAGHPEGHPVAGDVALLSALKTKQAYAETTGCDMWIVTQFAFAASPLITWEARLRQAGIRLPVRAGLPGPAKIRTLLAYALQCGIGASTRMLTQRRTALQLLGWWSPDTFVTELAHNHSGDPKSNIEGLHVFPFGGLEASLDWLLGMLEQIDCEPRHCAAVAQRADPPELDGVGQP